jgi:hypothetical protein
MQTPDRHELNAGWTIPGAYGIDRLVLLPRDPHWLFSYWEITPVLENSMRDRYPQWERSRFVMRMHNLSRGTFRDLDITAETDNWYFKVEDADCAYRAEAGRILPDGSFVSLLLSNDVRTPRDSISSVIDPRWKMFPFWQHRYSRRMREGGMSSFAFQTHASSWGHQEPYPGETGGEQH